MAECAEVYSAVVFDRGGKKRLGELLRPTKIKGERALEQFTSGSVSLVGQSCVAQANFISKISPRRHELRIYRGDVAVWEGPIQRVKTNEDTAEIIASDIGAYLAATPCSKYWPFDTGEPVGPSRALMTERIREIIEYELTTPYTRLVGTPSNTQPVTFPRWENIDPPANVLPYLDIRRSQTLYTWSEVRPFQMQVAEHLRNLARGGLAFTTVGRSLVIWDSATPLGKTRALTEADLQGAMDVILDGTEHYSISHATSSSVDADLPPSDEEVGSAGGEHPYYGVWTNLVTLDQEASGTASLDALNSQARRDQVGRTPVPLAIVVPSGTTLRLSNGLDFDSLVPGTIMPVQATLNVRKFAQDMLLQKVSFQDSAAGEEVKITLSGYGEVQEVV